MLPRVLLIHNSYEYRGGEDVVAQGERAMLSERGHDVGLFELDNAAIRTWSPAKKATLLWRVTWSSEAYEAIGKLIRRERPDVVHVHNFFPLVSPAVFYAASRAGVPVVYTLHNYRPLCSVGIFLRDGSICHECVERGPWRSVWHGCYKESRVASVPVAAMQIAHAYRRTWSRRVTLYIAPTAFVKRQFVSAGFPENRIVVKPHFLPTDPGASDKSEDYAVFVGQLAEKKGIWPLLEAWKEIPMPLKVFGDGPLEHEVRHCVNESDLASRVEFLGSRPLTEVLECLRRARFLVAPSLHHEGLPRVIVESYACGVPVVASRVEPFDELIDHGRTGLLFERGNPRSIVDAVRKLAGNLELVATMRRAAREEFEKRYTADENYRQLFAIYEAAINLEREAGHARA